MTVQPEKPHPYDLFVRIENLRHSSVTPRQRFPQDKLERLAKSLANNGTLEPLVVRRQLESGRVVYEIILGERRFRAALLAGLIELPVVIRDLGDNAARRLALIDQLEQERLSDLEEVEAIAELLQFELGIDIEGLFKLLNRMHAEQQKQRSLERFLSGAAGGAPLAEETETVLRVFLEIGRGSWQSFLTNSLRLLQFPEDILEGLRNATLPSKTAARILTRISSIEDRAALMDSLRNERWSTRRLEQAVDRKIGQLRPERAYLEKLKRISQHVIKNQDTFQNQAVACRASELIAELETLLFANA